MDGTLLDEDKRIPDGFWPLLEQMERRGISFAPASGRQHATLTEQFGAAGSHLDVIAENGAFVTRAGREVSASPLDVGTAVAALAALRGHARSGANIGVVLCGKRSAYIDRTDEPFVRKVAHYYKALEVVSHLGVPSDDEPLKIAVYDFDDAHATAEALRPLEHHAQVVVSDPHWVDVMAPGVNKGQALAALQRASGVTAAQTAVFGDFLNDLEMMSHAHLSYAMANAHPQVAAAARYTAPSHRDHGVVSILRELLLLSR
jgi:Cof subfamily protein (haloacid dehalogenase superfamily)